MMPFDERARRLRRRHHLRDELRVRLRLPARQHGGLARRTVQRGHAFAIVDEVDSILIDEARTPLIISGEPETAARIYYDFARVAKTLTRAATQRRRARTRRVQDADYLFDEKYKTVSPSERRSTKVERALRSTTCTPRKRPARQPSRPGAEGRGALPARRRLRDPGRRGQDRRRVHRPDHGGPPLVGGPAPGGRGEGGRRDPGGARHARDDHASELLPPLREARRHDRHGQDRGEGVRRDLRPRRDRDPDERPGRAPRQERPDLQDEGREVQRRRRRRQGALRAGPAGARRHDRGRDVRAPFASCSRARGSPTTC